MRRNRGLLLLLSTCVMVVFIVLSARPFAGLPGLPLRVAEERSAFSRKREESSRNDDESIARSQVKLRKTRDTD
jgi:hypothetical protein